MMDEYISLLPKVAVLLLGIYTIVFSNVLMELFGCKLQRFLKKSMLVKHIIGILLFFLVIIYSDPDITKRDIPFVIAITLITYLWFFLTTRMSFEVSITVVIILLIIFSMEMYVNKYKARTDLTPEEKENFNTFITTMLYIESVLVVIAILITLFGVVKYFIKKRKNVVKVFTTNENCNRNG